MTLVNCELTYVIYAFVFVIIFDNCVCTAENDAFVFAITLFICVCVDTNDAFTFIDNNKGGNIL